VEFLVGLVVALVATPLAASVARRVGIVDVPGPLKTHRRPVPYLGGVAVFAGLIVGVVAVDRVELLVPLALALALGIADDLRPLPAPIRLVAECGLGVVAGLVVPGDLLVRIATGGLVIVLVNAVNLLDGQDGLAASVAAVSALGFAVVGGEAWPFGLALAGALAGFLVFNLPPARIYLGDGGAYLLGTALALAPALTLVATAGTGSGSDMSALDLGIGAAGTWSVLFATPLFVAVPLADTAIAVVRRLRAGDPLFAGDRSHVYDQLVDRGWTVRGSTVVLAVAQVVLASVGVLAAGLGAIGALICTIGAVVVVAGVAGRGGFVGGGDARAAREE
jgi:UDP-GlcNAc:undecaprenyl-phosphate/decaprenyl-phosphate GlcNAc-1-phosphate transferase